MKIIDLQQEKMSTGPGLIEDECVVVFVEGYPHAQPVFALKDVPNEAALKGKLIAWKAQQDVVDIINAHRPTPPEPQPLPAWMIALEGRDL